MQNTSMSNIYLPLSCIKVLYKYATLINFLSLNQGYGSAGFSSYIPKKLAIEGIMKIVWN